MSDEFFIVPFQVKAAGTDVPPEQVQAAINSICQQVTTDLNEIVSGGFPQTNVDITGGTITGVTGATQGRLDNSLLLATDAFVNQQGASATATVPFAGVTGGVYNQATLGSGCVIVVFASGGVITSSLTIANPGSGYAVGDLLAVPAGNSDAVLRVTGVSDGGVTSVGIAYGGTGYTTGSVATAVAVPPGKRAVVFTGTLTSNLTFIIQNGTYLTASREVEFINNTTGAFTITVFLSNGADGHTGNGVVLPQGTNDSSAVALYTDGQNDVWLANTPLGIGAVSSTNPVITGGTINNTPIGATTPSTGVFTTVTAGSVFANGGAAPAVTATGTQVYNSPNPTVQFIDSIRSANNKNAFITWGSTVLAFGFANDAFGSFVNAFTITGGQASGISGITSSSGTGAWAHTGGFSASGGINSTVIGATTAAAGTFTTLTVTTSGTFAAINNTPIGPTTPSTGAFTTLSSTGNFTPSQTNGIVGTTTNNSANAGSVGEVVTATSGAVSLTSTVLANITSISLTAGDWDVVGSLAYQAAGTTTTTVTQAGISTTSATLPALPLYSAYAFSLAANAALFYAVPTQRISIASTTTVFLVSSANFAVSTATATGYIMARRVR
jgi:hypothetical protein